MKVDQLVILFGNFSPEINREDTFKPTIWNRTPHTFGINGVGVVKFATTKNLLRVQRCCRVSCIYMDVSTWEYSQIHDI